MIPPRARRSPIPVDVCHLAKAIDVLGDRWTLMILRSALYGVRRFDDFQAELGAPRTILSNRLKRLTEQDLLEKSTYREPGKRRRTEYVLTSKGAALRPILIGLTQWGDHWLSEDSAGAPISFSSKAGSPVRAGFIDMSGREVPPNNLRVTIRKTGTGT
ncbi:MAG: helix-turn-helix domain-containing protein [Pseudomonadota bacterium]